MPSEKINKHEMKTHLCALEMHVSMFVCIQMCMNVWNVSCEERRAQKYRVMKI